MKTPLRPLATSALGLVLGACVFGVQVTPLPPVTTAPAPTVSTTAPPTQAVGSPTPASLLAGVCGSVIGGVPSDGAHMFLTLKSGGSPNATYRMAIRKLSGGYHLGAYEVRASDGTRTALKWWVGSEGPDELEATARAVEEARRAGWPRPEWFPYGALPEAMNTWSKSSSIDGSELTGLGSRAEW